MAPPSDLIRSMLGWLMVSAWSNSHRIPSGHPPSAAIRSNTSRSARMVSSYVAWSRKPQPFDSNSRAAASSSDAEAGAS